MRVARSDTGAATGVLNTGGNFAGIVSAPVIGALSGAGQWNTTFVIGAVFAFVAAACWFAIDPDRRVITAPERPSEQGRFCFLAERVGFEPTWSVMPPSHFECAPL